MDKIKSLVVRGKSQASRLGTIAGLGLMSVAAMATDPAPSGVDYTSAITSFKDDFTSLLTTNGPVLMGALVVALGFGVVWKLIKRAAKSV